MRLISIILFFFYTLTASATNYYVSSLGNNGNNGLSTSTAWQTIAKVNSVWQAGQIKLLQSQSAVYSDRTRYMKQDSIDQWAAIKLLQLQVSTLYQRVAFLKTDSAKQWTAITASQLLIANLSKRMIAQEADSTAKGKQIRALQAQIKIVNTLETKGGALKMVKIGGLAYALVLDSAARFNNGYMTKYMWNKVWGVDTRVTALERFNQTMHGNTKAASVPITIPDKAKVIIIQLKE